MSNDRSITACQVLIADVARVQRDAERQRRLDRDTDVVDPWSYRAKLGLGVLRLTTVEFRILSFLAAHPYRAFTPRRIVAAVHSERHPVTAETLRHHVVSLRRQLGFYGDCIQTVPYIGYRFKA